MIAADPEFDLAVIRVQTTKKLRALRIVPANDLMVGETVIALGSPFDYRLSATSGIISALDREITMPGGVVLRGMIQHGAPINPGNSGGPLINLDAACVGINVALRDGAQGISFAIKAQTVDAALSRLVSAAKVAGLDHGMVCDSTVSPMGPAPQGVAVLSVAEESPAAFAGVQPGDFVVQAGGRPVTNRLDLERAFWDAKPGDRLEVGIWRHGRISILTLEMTMCPRAE